MNGQPHQENNVYATARTFPSYHLSSKSLNCRLSLTRLNPRDGLAVFWSLRLHAKWALGLIFWQLALSNRSHTSGKHNYHSGVTFYNLPYTFQHLKYVKYVAKKCEVEHSWTCSGPQMNDYNNNQLPEWHQQRETSAKLSRTASLCALSNEMHECITKLSELPTLTAFSGNTSLSDG